MSVRVCERQSTRMFIARFFWQRVEDIEEEDVKVCASQPSGCSQALFAIPTVFLKKLQTPFFCARFVLWYAIHRGGDADDIIVHNPALFAFGENLKNERPRTAFKAVAFCFREHFVSALDHSLTFLPRNYI